MEVRFVQREVYVPKYLLDINYRLILIYCHNCGIIVSMLGASVADRWFEPPSGQTKDFIQMGFPAYPCIIKE